MFCFHLSSELIWSENILYFLSLKESKIERKVILRAHKISLLLIDYLLCFIVLLVLLFYMSAEKLRIFTLFSLSITE